MPSKNELRRQLDLLPQDTPINIDPDLARMHEEFHLAGQTGEGISHSYISVPGMDDTARLISDLTNLQPTHLQNALEVWGNLLDQAGKKVFSDWSGPVLNLLGAIYRDHNPPNIIKHKI
jgi:hypothetical protein